MVRIAKTVRMGISNRFVRRVLLTSTLIILLLLLIDLAIQYHRSHPPDLPSQQKRNVTRSSLPQRISDLNNHSEDRQHLQQSFAARTTSKAAEALIRRPPSGSTVLRAILLFYPNDQDIEFQPELRWFYRSWIEMMAVESPLWRTDLIIYTTEFAPLFQHLGCVFNQIRQDSAELPLCRVFPYMRVKYRYAQHEPSSVHQKIDPTRSLHIHHHLKGYAYTDSINTVLEYHTSYKMYDFVLRTDMDCFLTKNFAHYIPLDESLIVGYGGYSTAFTNRRLKRIAQDMGWKYANRTSLGSTWFVLFVPSEGHC